MYIFTVNIGSNFPLKLRKEGVKDLRKCLYIRVFTKRKCERYFMKDNVISDALLRLEGKLCQRTVKKRNR